MLYLLKHYLRTTTLECTYVGARGNKTKFFCYKVSYKCYTIYISTDFMKICFINVYCNGIVLSNKEKLGDVLYFLKGHGIKMDILEDINITAFMREHSDVKQYENIMSKLRWKKRVM